MGGLQPKRWKDNANASCEHSFRRVAFIALLILLLLPISRFCLQVPEPCRHSGGRKFRFWTLSPKITKNEDVIFHKKITVFGVSYSELVDRAASHAACMAFEGFWFTSPFTLPARLPTQASCHLTRRLYGFCKPLFVKIPARANPQIRTVRAGKFLSFYWFSFCVVYPVWRPGPQYNVRLVRQTFTSGGRVWAAPPLRSFKILKS